MSVPQERRPGGSAVLLVTFARRGEEQAIRDALVELERGFPEAGVFAVATPDSAPVLKSVWVGDLIVYDARRPARRVLREVAARRPKAAAIVYASGAPEAHLKLEVVALGSGARAIDRCLAQGRVQVVGRLRLFGSVICKAALAGVHLLVAAGMCGLAFWWLRVAQLLAGGRRASRP